MRKEFFLHVRKGSKIRVEAAASGCTGLCVTMNYIGGQYGEVIWNLTNATDQTQYVGLVRGATLNINGQNVQIPEYLFGRAFAEVYFNVGLSKFGVEPDDFATPYTLAVYNGNTIGFVFKLDPNTTIHVPEYGFTNLVSYTARLVPVKLDSVKLFLDFYDYSEVIQYENQSGVNLGYLPDPIAFKSMVVEAPPNELGYSFGERVLFSIPEVLLNPASYLDSLIQKLKSLL